MPRLRVVAGPSMSELQPIPANSGIPYPITSDAFEGKVLVYIKGFTDKDGNILDSEYFHREDRKGITWSIQVQGRFLQPHSADDIMFGNTFDRPLKLPWGSGAALKFMKYIDPTLDHDLTSSTKPWALSPLIATMPHFAHQKLTHHKRGRSHSRSRSRSRSLAHAHAHAHDGSQHHKTRFLSPAAIPLAAARATDASEPRHWPAFPPERSHSDDNFELHLALRPGLGLPSAPGIELSPSGSSTSSEFSAECSSNASSSYSLPLDVEFERRKRAKKRLSVASLPNGVSHLSDGGSLSEKAGRKERRKLEKAYKHEEKHERHLHELTTAHKRRAYFSDAAHRKEIVFGPDDLITVDFCYGFLDFSPTLALRLPGGISFDLMHYWDGQPVRFVCCERKRPKTGPEGERQPDDEDPWGRIYWCVAIELAEDEAEKREADNTSPPPANDDVD